jgi:O-antigen polymerase
MNPSGSNASFSYNKWHAILFSLTFLTSFVISIKYTDPFFTPKYFFFFLTAGVFIFIMCIKYFNYKFSTSYSLNALDLSVLGLMLFSIVRTLFTEGISIDNIKIYILILNGILYFLVKPVLLNDSNDKKSKPVEIIVNILLIIAIIQSCWGVLQYFKILHNLQPEFKVGGAFGNPGQYTNFIAPLLSWSLAVAFFSKKYKPLGIIAAVCIFFVLPLTEARAAWIGAIFVVVYMLEKKYLLFKKASGVVKSVLLKLIILSLVVIIIAAAGCYLFNLKKDSSSGRLFIWKVSLQMVKDKPFWGFGFDRYAAAHNDYQADYFRLHPEDNKNAGVADGVNYAFNEFLQAWTESGIAACTLLVLIIYSGFTTQKDNSEDEEKNLQFYAAKGSLLVILISMLFSYPLHSVSSLTLFCFSLAIVSSYKKRKVFEFKIYQRTRKNIAALGLISVIIFMVIQYNRNIAEREWVKAYNLMRENRYEEANILYQDLYPTLKYSQFFLFNYGSELSLMGRYNESIKILRENEARLNDADHYIYLGNSYENLGNIEEAEKCYYQASCIMPRKFFPKFKLVSIYMQTGRKVKALELANSLLIMKIKVPSEQINSMKQEIQKMVDGYEKSVQPDSLPGKN